MVCIKPGKGGQGQLSHGVIARNPHRLLELPDGSGCRGTIVTIDQIMVISGLPEKALQGLVLAPTQELVSRDGMMGAGLNTRTGPICRTVQDAASHAGHTRHENTRYRRPAQHDQRRDRRP